MSVMKFSPELAKRIGINEAVIVSQVIYWQRVMKREVYNTYADWQKQLVWLSTSTVQRLILKLEKDGVITSRKEVGTNRKFYQANMSEKELASYQNDMASPQNDMEAHQNEVGSPQNEVVFQATSITHHKENNKKKKVEKDSTEWLEFVDWLNWWNRQRGQKRVGNENDFKNFRFWREHYSLLDMKVAISMMRYHDFWGAKSFAPAVVMRKFNRDGQTPCDRFGDFLNIQDPGNIELEALRDSYAKVKKWFADGQPTEQIADVFLALKGFGYEELATEVAMKAKENHVS